MSIPNQYPLAQLLYDTEMLTSGVPIKKRDSVQTILDKWKAFVKTEEALLEVQSYQAEWGDLPKTLKNKRQFKKRLVSVVNPNPLDSLSFFQKPAKNKKGI
jgi:hypothetical protein